MLCVACYVLRVTCCVCTCSPVYLSTCLPLYAKIKILFFLRGLRALRGAKTFFAGGPMLQSAALCERKGNRN